MAVVGDQTDRSLKLFQSHLQHISRCNIKVAGGLIEEKEVGRFEEHLCKDQTALLAAAQNGDLLFDLIPAEEKGSQEGPKLSLALIRGNGEEFLINGMFGTEEVELMLGKVGASHIHSGNDLAFLIIENAGQYF